MTRPKKKKTKGRQKSKAAQKSADIKAEKMGFAPGSGEAPPQYSGGMMSNMRGGFQSAVGQGDGKGKGGALNTILWVAVVGAATFLLIKQFQ